MLKAFLINVEQLHYSLFFSSNCCDIRNVIIMNPCSINITFYSLSKKVTLYFKVSLLHKLHVLIIRITLNYAQLHASNPKPNPNPNHIVSTWLINIPLYLITLQ